MKLNPVLEYFFEEAKGRPTGKSRRLAFSVLFTTYQGYSRDEGRYYDRFWGMMDCFSIAFNVPRATVYDALECAAAEYERG